MLSLTFWQAAIRMLLVERDHAVEVQNCRLCVNIVGKILLCGIGDVKG